MRLAMGTETRERADVRSSEETRLAPLYHVVLLDDQEHTYEYVVEMLSRLFGYGLEKALRIACEVDGQGQAVVYTGPLEVAELKQQQIHGYGADWRIPHCRGSMTAVLEPAEG